MPPTHEDIQGIPAPVKDTDLKERSIPSAITAAEKATTFVSPLTQFPLIPSDNGARLLIRFQAFISHFPLSSPVPAKFVSGNAHPFSFSTCS